MTQDVVLAIVAATSAIAAVLGAAVTQLLVAKTKGKELEAAATKMEADIETGLRKEMSIRLIAQDTKIDILTQNARGWQDKFYDVQLQLGLLKAENERLTERVRALEEVRDSLSQRVAVYETEREVMTQRIAALEAERLTLLNRITVLEGALTALRGVPINGAAMKTAERVAAAGAAAIKETT